MGGGAGGKVGGAAGGEVGKLAESGRGMRVMMLEVGKMVVEQMGDSLPRIGMRGLVKTFLDRCTGLGPACNLLFIVPNPVLSEAT